ncbi:L-2-amino-thiazoline-4-carboxylic acid hydrolase [Ruegeria sp. EL01]|uniref:L-2-amino-thiazoline-4-carboxylic acid hydrolase n=1 Tax=Ruegeria sp. EL01 TaxID=2107578 RepID=UPI000EA80FFC|nr:L-2-amino-thiazoline-4-carboxylic acid hydrolase [Ruegeria sp. EL01]
MTDNKVSPVEKRLIEAKIVRQILVEMIGEIGEEKAWEILDRTITKLSIDEGIEYARNVSCDATPESYMNLMMDWSEDGTLEIIPVSVSLKHAHFRINRCRYAEMYQQAGMTDLGKVLSCGRDGTVCLGYNPNITLNRAQTIMDGAAVCDFHLKLTEVG